MSTLSSRLDPVTYEILRHKLWAINDEQAMTMSRCSASNVANDIKDMNCGLLNAQGDVIVLGTYIALHALTMSFITKDVIQNYADNPGIQPGDMFICNDPYVGAPHQNDVTVIAPIFWKGELIMWAGACLHVRDVGGASPSSIQIGATNIYGEQPLMPPVKIVEGGRIRRDLEREYVRRSRMPHKNALDLRAKIAANLIAEKRLHELIESRGIEVLLTCIGQMVDVSEIEFRQKLRGLPDGTWSHRSYLDSPDAHYTVIADMTKRGDRLIFDYSRSGRQAPAIVNTTYPGLVGRTLNAVLTLLCSDIGWCPAGIMRALEVKSRPGTIVHAEWPAGCCMATTAGSWAAENVAAACIGKMLAASEETVQYLQAGWMGGQAVDHISGVDQRGERYQEGILDSMFGGAGARHASDGIDTGGFLCSISLAISNVETYEYLTPVHYLYRKQMSDSGGAGAYRGGVTSTALYTLAEEGTIETKIMGATGVSHPPTPTVYAGYPSTNTQFAILRNSNVREKFRQGEIPDGLDDLQGAELEIFGEQNRTSMRPGDVYHFVSTGGAGYGDPLEREPALVLNDCRNHLVSREGAARFYGVVVSADGQRIDSAETASLRSSIRTRRLGAQPRTSAPSRADEVVSRINDYLRVVAGERDRKIACRCGHVICGHDQNYKQHAVMSEHPLEHAGMHIQLSPRTPQDRFVWREFYCPSCALLLTNELALAGDPVLEEVMLAN
ncbi:MAG: hydantoinase B/oxoprolinase family protein [Steroidobacteraceae bacterium]